MSAAPKEIEKMKPRRAGRRADWPSSWNATPHSVGTGRYIDSAFAKLEFEKLWSNVWQAAARVDEIPEAGDYTTYSIGDQSILLVRVDKETIKAYHNVCPHRGTSLGEGCGSYKNSHIICPFHGWRWNLAGEIQFVLERQEFRQGELRDSDVHLKEVKTVVFAGFVFINLASNPRSFDEFIAPVRHWLEDMRLSEMHPRWWKVLPVPANWKVAQEAFFEGYHVPATHPQLEPDAARAIQHGETAVPIEFAHHNVSYEAWTNGHGRFFGGKKTPMAGHVNARGGDAVDAMAARLDLLVDGLDAMVRQEDVDLVRSLKGTPIPDGSSLGAEYVRALYADAAAKQRPMPKPTPEIIGMWGGEIYVFPNLMILPQAGNAMIYRALPHATDPNQCTFEIFSTTTLPAAEKPQRAVAQHVTDLLDPNQVRLIPRQDIGNIPRIQKGLHSRGIKQVYLAANQEKLIVNMHQELDRYLRA